MSTITYSNVTNRWCEAPQKNKNLGMSGISFDMNTKQILEAVGAFKIAHACYQNTPKGEILNACYNYAERSLATSMLKKDRSRYDVVSNLLTFAGVFDDLHYYRFAVDQLDTLPLSSTLKKNLMPIARRNLDTLLAPSVATTQKAFAGLFFGGIALLFTGLSGLAGLLLTLAGVIGYVSSDYITHHRMKRSLMLEKNLVLTRGKQTSSIRDGMQDEFAIFERTAADLMRKAQSIFSALALAK